MHVFRYSLIHRITASLLLPFYASLAVPSTISAQSAEQKTRRPLKDSYVEPWVPPAPVLTSPSIVMNRAASALGIEEPVGKADLSAVPDLTEIAAARILRAPTPADPASTIGASEQPALSKALASYAREGGQFNPQNLTLLDQHLNSFSDSPLRATLLLEKAELCKRNGHFVKALDAFELVWNENKNLTNNDGIRMAERALKEVLFLASHLGQKQTLTRLISEVKERDLGGDATEAVFKAHEALWFLNNRAERNIFCGFTATNLVCVPQGDPPIFPDVHNESEKKAFIRDGLSLFELRAHSLEEGGSLRIFKRSKGSPLVVPSVIHWVFNHYSAVTEQMGDLYRIQDPHLRFDGWITREFLEEQTSGYLLVSGKTQIPKSYAKVSDKEAKGVFGRHCVHARDDEGDDCTKGGNCSSCAMATYSFRMLNPGLVVTDTPITHQPAYGPAVNIRVVYDQRSTVVADRSADYANFGPQWTHGLNAYVVKVGTGPVTSPNSSVRAVRGDGVYYQYSNLTNSNNYSNPKFADRPQLVFVPGTAGIRGYKLLYPDGSEELYTKADGISETRYFLTKVTDAFGKALSIQYDTSLRITSVVDALNGVTTFSYTPAAGDGVPTDTFKIRSITDPFNRKAQFAYDASGRLRKIVDPMGITSEFRYGKNDFIEQVITPYGVAIFQTGDLPGINEEPGRFIEAVDPYGNRERMEANDFAFGNKYGISELAMVNEETGNRPPPTSVRVGTQDVPFLPKVANLHYRNTFYWDKKQMAYHAGDYSMATIYNWLTVTDDKITSVLASVKKPLEGRVWFNYPGQTSEHSIGKTSMPSKVVRAVEQADGSLVYTMEQLLFEQSGSPGVMANGYGFPVGKVDAEGRRVRYQFASNQLDLTAVEVDENGAWRTLYSFSNYLNRLPQTVSDASGLARNYTYNPAGQVTQIVTSKGTASEITRFFYKRIPGVDVFLSGSGDGDGYLMRVEQSVAGGTFVPIAEFTYDAALRVRQARDVDKYTLKYDYDNFDRVTLITHPDSTTEQFVYDKLDLHAEKDRGGLWTRTFYNSLRQPVVTQDPKGRFTTLEWCRCGSLSKVIDPMGKTTWWKRDSQGRVTEKLMPDGVTATRYQYQPKSGRLASVTMPNNAGQANTVAYAYSLGGQLLKEDYADPATPDVSYRYDDFMARLTSHADGLGTTNYAYHPLIGAVPGAGMLQSINGPRTDDTLRYGYDWHSRLSRRELVTDSGSILRSEEVLFDSLGRADLVTNQLGAFDLVYNAGNNGPRVDAVVAPNGLRTDFTYHPLSATGGKALLLSGISHSRNGSALASFTYDYDPSGRITTWGRNLGGVAGTWAFEYSRASELTGATLKPENGSLG